ncbi:hypothetical protein BDN72DRAFT_842570 [Pluteus cervinus]|uniref:Uncharacterized protein n=1 Tax=Pluteus cervinus TaxID=181527 RepID=A0ACD3AR75_9AGAR|nr:hypothetical protein BDN72DRAFT_842570 [Pluteus cervinus]
MYWDRLDKLFRDADEAANRSPWGNISDWRYSEDFPPVWKEFIGGLVKEWETLNVVSALLLSALFSIFGLDTGAYARTFAVLSFVCALTGLLYGCTYIIRFGTVKRMVEARAWIRAIEKGKDSIGRFFWNEWTLLAMPAVWLAWSILFFLVSLFFLWEPKPSQLQSSPDSPYNFSLGSRISTTVLLALGMLYYCVVLTCLAIGWDLHDLDEKRDRHAPDARRDSWSL